MFVKREVIANNKNATRKQSCRYEYWVSNQQLNGKIGNFISFLYA